MPRRFVIPVAAKPGDRAYSHRAETWQRLADDLRAEIAHLGDAWCVEYGVDGLGLAEPTETLAERAAREEERERAGENRRTVEQRARAAIAANATFLALTSPTNAQVLAQVRRLTQECNAVIKLVLGDLDDTEGT